MTQFSFDISWAKRVRRFSIPALVAVAIYRQFLLLAKVNNSGPNRLIPSNGGRQMTSFGIESQTNTDPFHTTAVSTPSISASVPQNSSWAYAFLLGGARLDRKGSDYRSGLFSVVAVAHALRSYGSTADIVLMVQLSVHADIHVSTLEPWHEDMLQKLNIRILYIPRFAKPVMECFYSLVMEKFRILSLTEYSRVMFMDYDVFPKCNLDYLFHLSDPQGGRKRMDSPTGIWNGVTNLMDQPKLKENVVLGYKREPSNAGLFILEPNAGDYEQLLEVIRKKEVQALELPYPHWDEELGWGHRISQDDPWRSNFGETGTNWTWAFAYADQGLLFYWAKYIKKTVSLVRHNVVENWGVDESGNLRVESTTSDLLDQYAPCDRNGPRPSPYSDFTHFTGIYKPWNVNHTLVEQALWTTPRNQWQDREIWFYHLVQALSDIHMMDRVSFEFMGESDKNPSVGRASSFVQMAMYLRAKKRNGWNQYQTAGVTTPKKSISSASSNGWDEDEGEDGGDENDLLIEVLNDRNGQRTTSA
ncbi:hypothetical protein IV203_003901 [Nitzschia inconspicua]|uniref:Nucleotide-diphospho-sugar transferase n=1 Tax=Nitzschia inconspicua TaxID=303405 RepID=A0A9K3L2M4_9STRA|nr:hypothetical protein IV203_003901 [Nitzschia inconspicua]